MASKTDDRNARLNSLGTAVTQWANKRRQVLNDQVTIAKSILQGRTGSDRLPAKAVAAASEVVVDSIDEFLSTLALRDTCLTRRQKP